MNAIISRLRASLQTVWRFLKRSPIGVMMLYMIICLQVQENYPFSHYPMYSNPSPERPYYMVTDEEGKPIAVGDLTGITSPKVGKRYRTFVEEEAKKLKVKAVELPAAGQQAAGMRIFQQLREGAAKRKRELPAKLQLIRAELSFEDGKVKDSFQTMARE
jgi:hypothetical protein